MAIRPNNWVEEERETFAETIATRMVEGMTDKEKDRIVWDQIFEELMNKEWPDLWADAEEFATHLVEPLASLEAKESQKGSY